MRLRPRQTPFHLSLGERGEMIAWDFLVKQGYKILEKNYRCKVGEADVVALKGGRLTFVEVKTRSSHRYGLPEESVHRTKQKKLVLVAEWYRKEKKLSHESAAFAVIAIDWNRGANPQIRFFEDAFDLGDVG